MGSKGSVSDHSHEHNNDEEKCKDIRIRNKLNKLKFKLLETKESLIDILSPDCETRIKQFTLTKKIDLDYDFSKTLKMIKEGVLQ